MIPLRNNYRKSRFSTLKPLYPEQDETISNVRLDIRNSVTLPLINNQTIYSQNRLTDEAQSNLDGGNFTNQTDNFNNENMEAESNQFCFNEGNFNKSIEIPFEYETIVESNNDCLNSIESEESEVIYPDSHVTVKNSSFFLLAFMERFNLSEVCREELLTLLQYHLPLGNKVAKSIHKLNANLDLEKSTVYKRLFCQKCYLEVIKGPLNENQAQYYCNCNLQIADYDSFLYIDVFDQLSFLIKKYHDNMEAQLENSRDFLDLTDGDYYKSIKKLNKRHVVIYADGTPVRKTTQKRQFWPVVIGLAELPLSLRESIKNKIICGNLKVTYCGNLKGPPVTFFNFKNKMTRREVIFLSVDNT